MWNPGPPGQQQPGHPVQYGNPGPLAPPAPIAKRPNNVTTTLAAIVALFAAALVGLGIVDMAVNGALIFILSMKAGPLSFMFTLLTLVRFPCLGLGGLLLALGKRAGQVLVLVGAATGLVTVTVTVMMFGLPPLAHNATIQMLAHVVLGIAVMVLALLPQTIRYLADKRAQASGAPAFIPAGPPTGPGMPQGYGPQPGMAQPGAYGQPGGFPQPPQAPGYGHPPQGWSG
ncbi:hypothetical protein [Streptoalloteichus hindustanus]|uniref:Uncharacterized protein n=1 Tax=Streptoalloteichus hindustanus TaxID=2017 RepID=A0A1M5KSA5_STRHI|nr:hypothetical protein [Streptoalloteichus hindustanus]SHG55043.1 hypothetical protein SAMN05444320_11012 [Streptoalloteichus hindustanus]